MGRSAASVSSSDVGSCSMNLTTVSLSTTFSQTVPATTRFTEPTKESVRASASSNTSYSY